MDSSRLPANRIYSQIRIKERLLANASRKSPIQFGIERLLTEIINGRPPLAFSRPYQTVIY